jgi:thymidylate synthase
MENNLDKQYLDIMCDILHNGHTKGDRTGTGTKSLFSREIRHNMRDGFPLLTTKKLYTKGIIHELLWFLKGDTNIKYLKDNKTRIWDEWADKDGDLGPVYGKQWVNWGGTIETKFGPEKDALGHLEKHVIQHRGINQIQNAVDLLKKDPDSRRIMVNAWNVGELDDMALMPCHYGFQLYARELSLEERVAIWDAKHLHTVKPEDMLDPLDLDGDNIPTREVSLKWTQRSADYLLGVPYNIASYAFLLEMFAQQTNMVAGELIGSFGDVHLYNNHIKYAEEQLERDYYKYKLPKLKLNKAKDMFSYTIDNFVIEDYEAYPNWTGEKKPPIAV